MVSNTVPDFIAGFSSNDDHDVVSALNDYVINMKIDMAPTGNANITLTPTGTATQGVDYDFTTNGNFAAPSNNRRIRDASTSRL